MVSRVFQPNFAGGILGSGMYARSDTTKYAVGLKDAQNVLIMPQGGIHNRAGFRLASGFDTGSVTASQWLIPFTLTSSVSYLLEFAENVFRVLSDGAYVLDSSFTAKGIVNVTTASPARLTMASAPDAATYTAGDLVYVDDPNGDHALGEQILRVASVSGEFITFDLYDGQPVDTTTGDWGTIGASAVLEKVYSATHPYDLDEVPFVRFAQDNLDMYLAHPSHPVQKLTFTAIDNWSMGAFAFNPSIDPPAGLGVTNAGSGTDYNYKVSSLALDTLEESLPSAAVLVNGNLSTNDSVLTWTAEPGAALYNIYRETDGGYWYIGTTASLTFNDTNITPSAEITPKTARNPFPSANNYPSIVNFVEQRLALGATINDPQLIEMSGTAAFSNFTVSYPQDADDALRFRLRTKERNEIRAMVSARALLVLTSSAEWVVTGNENEGVLTPTSIVPNTETYWGSYDIEPLTVGEVAMFVEPAGNVIRAFDLALRGDAESMTQDLSILVRDLFDGWEITSWTFTKAPQRAVWVTLNNGELLTLTFMREHDVWGWTRQKLGGTLPFVYQVTSVREGARDVLYAVVGRVVNGRDVIMVERLDRREDREVEDAFFLDSGLSYDGVPAAALSGLLHLRGETVNALIDGSVYTDLLVDAQGVVELPVAGERVHLGLPYEAFIETLDIDFETEQDGSMQGRFKALGEVAINLRRTRGLAVGRDLANAIERTEWNASMVGGPIPLLTGTVLWDPEGDWLRNATVVVVQRYPLPMTILGIAPEWAAGA